MLTYNRVSQMEEDILPLFSDSGSKSKVKVFAHAPSHNLDYCGLLNKILLFDQKHFLDVLDLTSE